MDELVGIPGFGGPADQRQKRINIENSGVYPFAEYHIQIAAGCGNSTGQSAG